jgi:ubiquitin carboxyl-terminal hydrolase 7
MYLDVADSANLPYGWSRSAQFSLSVVNQIDQKYTTQKGVFHLHAVHNPALRRFAVKLE